MKYRDISWNLIINGEQASFDDNAFDFISEEIQHGNTSGFFTTDCTDYDKCDELKEKLTDLLGRDIDFSVEEDDKGELEELLTIAQQNNDSYVVEIITALLEIGFDYKVEE